MSNLIVWNKKTPDADDPRDGWYSCGNCSELGFDEPWCPKCGEGAEEVIAFIRKELAQVKAELADWRDTPCVAEESYRAMESEVAALKAERDAEKHDREIATSILRRRAEQAEEALVECREAVCRFQDRTNAAESEVAALKAALDTAWESRDRMSEECTRQRKRAEAAESELSALKEREGKYQALVVAAQAVERQWNHGLMPTRPGLFEALSDALAAIPPAQAKGEEI